MRNRPSRDIKIAETIWGDLPVITRLALKHLISRYKLSIIAGDLQLIEGRWYVTHAGLLNISQRRHCAGLKTTVEENLSTPEASAWVFRATVYKAHRSRGFIGYGDACPSNVSPLLRGSEMRIAETRAVNRALRKAYGIGLCSVEELGWEPKANPASAQPKTTSGSNANGHRNGNVRLRDRLCLLIRQHQLDANLVKAYAADFCGTPNLREASREQIENFITKLGEWANKDRSALLCKLNSYSTRQEITS